VTIASHLAGQVDGLGRLGPRGLQTGPPHGLLWSCVVLQVSRQDRAVIA
jgi:hypothetical protein